MILMKYRWTCKKKDQSESTGEGELVLHGVQPEAVMEKWNRLGCLPNSFPIWEYEVLSVERIREAPENVREVYSLSGA